MASKGSTTLQVALVHGLAVVRAGLRALLEEQGDIAVVVEAGPETELGHVFTEDVPVAVAVVELSLPMRLMRDRVRWLQRHRAIPVLAYGALTERIADELMELGVCGLLPAEVEAEELHRACLVASAGGYHANAWTKAGLKQGSSRKAKRGGDEPSPKQYEMLKWLHAGLTLQGIGEKMNISRRGVETHRDALFVKFGVHRLPCLLREAIARRLV